MSTRSASPATSTSSIGTLSPTLPDILQLPSVVSDFILDYSTGYNIVSSNDDNSVGFHNKTDFLHYPRGSLKALTYDFDQDPLNTTTTNGSSRRVKLSLRQLLREDALINGIAWVAKCSPEQIYTQDSDGDSLLHICIHHKDSAKIYALTERILRERMILGIKDGVLDRINQLNETPLCIAVERHMPEVVTYLLEHGANPNTIVLGYTPLMWAVMAHGTSTYENGPFVDNTDTIEALLIARAKCNIQEKKSGNSVLHLVACQNPQLIKIFKEQLDDYSFDNVMNLPNREGNTPFEYVENYVALIDDAFDSAI